jgi:hypothetical protein
MPLQIITPAGSKVNPVKHFLPWAPNSKKNEPYYSNRNWAQAIQAINRKFTNEPRSKSQGPGDYNGVFACIEWSLSLPATWIPYNTPTEASIPSSTTAIGKKHSTSISDGEPQLSKRPRTERDAVSSCDLSFTDDSDSDSSEYEEPTKESHDGVSINAPRHRSDGAGCSAKINCCYFTCSGSTSPLTKCCAEYCDNMVHSGCMSATFSRNTTYNRKGKGKKAQTCDILCPIHAADKWKSGELLMDEEPMQVIQALESEYYSIYMSNNELKTVILSACKTM